MFELQPKTFDDFLDEAGRGNVVPIVRSVLADLQTPVGAFMRIAAAPYSFLLESVEGGERVARYSFLGANPYMILRGRCIQTIIAKHNEREIIPNVHPITYLRDHVADR